MRSPATPTDVGEGEASLRSDSFHDFAAICALLVGVVGLVYSIAFVVDLQTDARSAGILEAATLGIGGLLSTAVVVGVYDRLRSTDPLFSLLALILGLIGAVGAMIHGGFDLANLINPPSTATDLPNAVDPRGLLTFGVSGLAVGLIAGLMLRSGAFPSRLGGLGYLLSFLLIVIYLGRLILLDPENPVLLIAVALAGFIVYPVWYVWLGVAIRARTPSPAVDAGASRPD